MATDSLRGESLAAARPSRAAQFFEMWARRVVTVPAYLLLCVTVVGSLPLLLGVAAIADLLRGGPWPLVRAVTFFAFYLACESLGIIASVIIWLSGGTWLGIPREQYLDRNVALQECWAVTLFRGVQRIFGLRAEVEEVGDVGRGPVIVFIRHASVGDTLLPAVLLSKRYGLRLRYVLKRELLWDPCLDIVGNRLPNYFVRRGSDDGEREIAAMQELMENLGPRDGVLIYPEGTRFTPAKRARILQRLETSESRELFEAARGLRHVLPPRLGGALGLLERNTGAAAVFCAHVGFEGTTSFNELLNGSLVRQVIRVRLWRVPFEEIPTERAARAAWLFAQWQRIDEWIETTTTATHRG
jgi:1-acyl-sn-glycerol-3-phosphate acyltransferase